MKTDKLLLLPLILLFSSCATIFTRSSYGLKVDSEQGTKLKYKDSIYTLPAVVEIKRSSNPIEMEVIKDSIKKKIRLIPSLSPTFLYRNLYNFPYAVPIGYLVDLTNPKRYYYGRKIFVNATDTITKINTPTTIFYQKKKKQIKNYFQNEAFLSNDQINLTFGLPYFNSFTWKPSNYGTVKSYGFFGLSAGIEYYLNPKRFLAFQLGTGLNFPIPVPAPLTRGDEYQNFVNTFYTLTDNYVYKRFSFGYGLHFNHQKWIYYRNTYYTKDNVKYQEEYNSLGAIFQTQFKLVKCFYIGLNYKPSFFQFSENKMKSKYEHGISVEFQVKLPIHRPKKIQSTL